MNNKNIPTYQGISFQVPDCPESQRIDQSLEKIMKKAREVSERIGKTKEDIYDEIGFDPEIFVDDYSRNFGYFEDLLSPEEASDYITSKLDELVQDSEETKLKKYGDKIKKFLGGKGFAFLTAGALLGATALSGCVGDAVAPSLPEHDGEVDIANNPDNIVSNNSINNSLDEPDLVTNFYPTVCMPGLRCHPRMIHGIVKNIGNGESEPTNVTYEIYSLLSFDPMPIIDPLPMLPLTKIKEYEANVKGLSPGEKTSFELGYEKRRPLMSGSFLSKATVDPEHNVDESNEWNNVDWDIYYSPPLYYWFVFGGYDRWDWINYDWFPRQEPKGPTGYKNSFEGDGTGDAKTLISEAFPSTDIPSELLDSEIAKNSLDEPDLVTNFYPTCSIPGIRLPTMMIHGKVKNIGNEESEPTNATYEIYSLLSFDPMPIIDPLPMPPLTKIKEYERNIKGLSPGEKTSFDLGHDKRRPVMSGLFLTKATIDPEHNVDESNEWNNVDWDIYYSPPLYTFLVYGGKDRWRDWE